MRQINRQDAEKLIMTTMSDFRRREVRKWRFGTHFTDFHRFANGTTKRCRTHSCGVSSSTRGGTIE